MPPGVPPRRLLLFFAAINRFKEDEMTICPIAIVAGCKKCPAFAFCPLKTIIGDYKKPVDVPKK
jgi:hypothetical protein